MPYYNTIFSNIISTNTYWECQALFNAYNIQEMKKMKTKALALMVFTHMRWERMRGTQLVNKTGI